MASFELTQTDEKILEKLAEVSEQFNKIESEMNNPAVAANASEMTRLAKEHGKLRPMVESYLSFTNLYQQYKDAVEMAEDKDMEADMREMALEEADELVEQLTASIETIKEKLVMSDDASINSVIIEIRAGTGGDEAALFAGDLYTMYKYYCEKMGWKVEDMEFSSSPMGGYKEVIFGVKGDGVWAALGYEGGGHRVQRVPETESQGRIHTSAATVAVLPEPEDVEIDIKKDDVVEHVARSSGPGGQSVNKTNSAIKLEHLPTGITVSMQDEKSQHKNRAKAWRILKSRVFEKFMQEKNAERADARKDMIGSGDRSQRIRTYNFPQNRVTDHRINLSLYSLDKFMVGEIEQMVKALIDYDKQQRLANI